jgi:ATP-dependent Clp protease protease subunit
MPPKNLLINGTIVPTDYQEVYNWIGQEATSPGKVRAFLEKAKNADITVDINSPGGMVYAGFEIYNLLKDYPGKVTARVMSLAASAASMIMCAADHVQISPLAQIMIHNVQCQGTGDYRDFQKTAEELKQLNKVSVQCYIQKTGKTEEELLKLMDNTTFMSAQEAVKNGFADEIMYQDKQDQLPKVAAAESALIIPPKVFKALSEYMELRKNETAIAAERERLAYLELKGE